MSESPFFGIISPTHDPRWIKQTWQSLKLQEGDHTFEWIISVNDKEADPVKLAERVEFVKNALREEGDADDPRVRILVDDEPYKGIGQRKRNSFTKSEAEVLVELDHDDLLTPDAFNEMHKAFADPEVGFVYSDWIDFEEGAVGQGHVTYRFGNDRVGWAANGFTFYEAEVGGVRPGVYEVGRSFKPGAACNSLVFWAPNHVRAWHRTVYHAIGCHDPAYELGDDHELLCRTYLHSSRMHHIPKPLYLYRVGSNTWLPNVAKIADITRATQDKYLERLVLRECQIDGFPAYDLGSGLSFSKAAGWKTVDIEGDADVRADLRERWPFEDNSVGAFRACDFLEHLPDKVHTMSEIWRCLRPGGWLLSRTPSTDGRGAWMDPTHVSQWCSPGFWYWTRAESAKYIRNSRVRFIEMQLYDCKPTPWHELHNIPYVVASLVAIKPGYTGPGERKI